MVSEGEVHASEAAKAASSPALALHASAHLLHELPGLFKLLAQLIDIGNGNACAACNPLLSGWIQQIRRREDLYGREQSAGRI